MRATSTVGPAPSIIPVNKIKEELTKNIGKQIKITELNRNTKKAVSEFCGIIKATYNNLFSITIKYNKTYIEKCFNYSGFSVGLLKFEILD